MQPSNMSDTENLTDSSFEIISHGGESESQDDHLSESTSSLSIPQPDDVRSLDGSENPYDNDSDNESDDASRASSIRYTDQALQNPSTQLPASSLEYGSSTEGSGVVVGSIEFHEENNNHNQSVLEEEISVKHAIREFTEEESSAMAEHLALPNAPRRLVATVRQTMTQGCLSTREPLRVLYVGPAQAQRSIVLKICSAICASAKNDTADQEFFNRRREGVYNIVPISSFGPAPELELMEASSYQIKVEHCTSAMDGFSEEAALVQYPVFTLTVDQGKTYKSSPSLSGDYIVQPKWDLPHIAVFYTSELDSSSFSKAAAAYRTMVVTHEFMYRHGIPCIFIGTDQSFENHSGRNWERWIDEHTVHLCLESRDPERPTAPKRFPIDYASFMDIDARQMNRHLAYLTGLCDSEQTLADSGYEATEGLPEVQLEVIETLSSAKAAFAKLFNRHAANRWILAFVVPVLLSVMAPFLFRVFLSSSASGDMSAAHSPLSTGTCVPSQSQGLTTTRKTSSVATSTTTVVINVTSTKTIQVSQAKPSTSALASALSFDGFLSDKPVPVAADPDVKRPTSSSSSKNTVCSVRVYSPTEFLVEIPSRNKAVWLAHGAIDIDVHRGEDSLKTKLSSVDEGVLVELPLEEAHGVLNVSVVTNRRPKINETFQVDFGKSTTIAEAFEAGLHLLQDGIKKVSSSVGEASHAIEGMLTIPDEVVSYWEHASETVRTAQHRAAGTVHRAADNVRERFARQLESVETLRKEADLSVLQARITSRLWWLKVQGKVEEYEEYKRNASRFLKMKHGELLKGQKVAEEKGSAKKGIPTLFGKRVTWGCKGDRVREVKDEGRDSRWKKMILGGGG